MESRQRVPAFYWLTLCGGAINRCSIPSRILPAGTSLPASIALSGRHRRRRDNRAAVLNHRAGGQMAALRRLLWRTAAEAHGEVAGAEGVAGGGGVNHLFPR